MAEFRKYALELDSSTALTHKKSNLDPVGFSAAVAKEHVRGVGCGVPRGDFADPQHPTQGAVISPACRAIPREGKGGHRM